VCHQTTGQSDSYRAALCFIGKTTIKKSPHPHTTIQNNTYYCANYKQNTLLPMMITTHTYNTPPYITRIGQPAGG
ncbi:MAG TPA: hypothetical protein PK239_18820, partial [Chitinophagales bacterium]|nr:hypothetical protein [Chitinophagales bacterium]